jgi:2-polyprenyl-3-methyl-5-hydroxy-6-metoxy-1,4-benzoquinol methylase
MSVGLASSPSSVYSPEDVVRACYRVILNREAEDDRVIAEKIGIPIESIIEEFLNSPERISKISETGFSSQIYGNYYAGYRPVETEGTPEQMLAMFERIRRSWSKLGEVEPYWSVITHDDFKMDVLSKERQEHFYETGRASASLIDLIGARAGHVPAKRGVCLELGCGVGRVTAHLASRFEQVIAVDVSPGNLQLCKDVLKDRGINNVETRLITDVREVESLPEHDFFYSVIVLQHNPPPIQAFLLDNIFKKLNCGASFLFQVPTHTPGYEHKISEYLDTPEDGIEMHCMPMAKVFDLMNRHQLLPLEVIMDSWTGMYGSHTFFGRKAA